MTAFGFKQRFAPAIIAKTKTQTVREFRKDGRYPPLDSELQLFTGMRTKNCVRLGTATVVAVGRLVIDWPKSWIHIDGTQHSAEGELDGFARADGFASWQELSAFFTATHGAVDLFEGFVTTWGDTFVRTPRSSWPAGHVVHMSLDHDVTPSASIAACDCGWTSCLPWRGGRAEQDAAIEQHWSQIERQAQ